MQGGLSNSTRWAVPSSKICSTLKVEYASFRTLHTGSVFAMVSTTSAMLAPSFSIVDTMVLVSVERILALTPLPRPSASTAMVESGARMIFTLSPQSSSPYLLRLRYAASTCIFIQSFLYSINSASEALSPRRTRSYFSAWSAWPWSPPWFHPTGSRSAALQPSACR